MKKLRLYMIVFGVLVALPLAFVAWRTYNALDREAEAQVRFFAERLLDEIEAELSDLVRREENRAVDAYHHTLVQQGATIASPLAQAPAESFILGYFQNNPDGSFQTPLTANPKAATEALAERVRQLESVNAVFNRRKRIGPAPPSEPVRQVPKPALVAEKEQSAFAERFLKASERQKTKSVLGRQEARVEQITADQAMNLAQVPSRSPASLDKAPVDAEIQTRTAPSSGYRSPALPADEQLRQTAPDERFQVEVAPLQAVAIDGQQVFVFRRIGIGGQLYRQGFVLRVKPFLDHLMAVHYSPQPISGYTRLSLKAAGQSATRGPVHAGPGTRSADLVAGRTFPAPFGFLSAEMRAVALPPSPARQTLTLALGILSVVMVAGLIAIHRSARAVLDLSERRQGFVSAVTHELKTPLTNIRLYIEMLDQGIAATAEREQEYLGILAAESARLSGLINNVLELSRLEKRTRRFVYRQGDLSDVLADVRSLMAGTLAREGFELAVAPGPVPAFAYDRDVLVQVLINLMENSIKFGRHASQKRIVIAAKDAGGRIAITVSDTGPGIPRRALKRVFDDFYRADDDLARATGGTGIGLALVKKFVTAMGGRVWARNNDGPGCTIGLDLPMHPETKG